MSRIIAKVVDRTIEFTDMPPIYSGSKNVDDVQFQFDSEWDSFTKTAVFYRDESNPFMAELTSDICTIPHEVLSRDGKIYIGVFGELDDKVITSEVFIYTISRGALTDPVSSDDPTFWDKLLEIKNDILQAKEDAHTYADEAKEWAKQAEQNAGHFYNGIIAQGETYSGIASNKGIKLHSVVGKTSQKTTNGYQLFDVSKVSNKTQGGATLTNNNDGSITISGSGYLTENFSLNYYYSKEESQKLLKAGTLTVNGLGNVSPNLIIGLRNRISGTFLDGKSVHVSRTSITLTEEDIASISDDIVFSFSFYTSQGTAIQSGTIKPMLYQDGDGTWEQFTGGKPAPNLDYAMPIENVEITKIYSTAKNIVKSFKTASTTQYSGALEVDALFKPNTTYTITLTSKYVGKFYLNESLFTLPTKATFTNPNETKSVTATTLSEFSEQNAKYILKNAENNTTVEFSNVQIEEGEESTEYVVGNYSKIETSLTLAEGDVFENGILTRKRVKIEINENSYIVRNDSYPNTRFECSSRYNSSYVNGVLGTGVCNRLKVSSLPVYGNTMDETITCYKDGGLYFRFDRFSTVEELKEWLKTNPIIYEYDLLTPTTEELKVPTVPSYYPQTNIWTDNTLPTDIEWELLANSDNSLEIEEILKRVEALESKAIGG